MPEHPFISGYIKDTKDERDYPATRLIVREVALPDTFKVNEETIIYDQGIHPACVGFAGVGVKTDEEFLERGKQIRFDGLRLYQECKKRDGIPDVEGTYPRVACKVLKDTGCWIVSAASTCPFRLFKPKPPEPNTDEVFKWHIDGYYRIEPGSTDEFIKQVIFQYGSIMTASNWYAPWSGKFGTFPTPSGGTVGGHAYRVVGWTMFGWIVVNSWGKIVWGSNGQAVMPFDMFRKYVLAEGDCWKLVDHIPESLQN